MSEELPIYSKKNEILDLLKTEQCILICSETGSGKTTQIPQILDRNGSYTSTGMIAVTQPRRVAAITVSNRVASEMGVKVGNEVGYSIRFDDKTSNLTRIKYMTDGMLVRDVMSDPLLKKYSVIILDEAHERSLNTDVMFAIMKTLLSIRKELRLIVMSATLSSDDLSKYFDNAPVVSLKQRQFDVQIKYAQKPETDRVDGALITILQIHTEEPDGHILVFLTGQDEIERTAELLKAKIKKFPSLCSEMKILPIFAALPTKKQVRVFKKAKRGVRKVILATNIAESSITIEDVRYVVDCGHSKKKFFDAKGGVDVMVTDWITKSEATQRAGRAGRMRDGVCYRLYPETTFSEMQNEITPEILRSNLSQLVLLLKSLNIQKISQIDFMTSPDLKTLNKAIKTLYYLGAINSQNCLTPIGRKMVVLPIDPIFSKALVKSIEYGCVESVLTIISILAAENVWVSNHRNNSALAKAKRMFSKNGEFDDMITLLQVYNEFTKERMSRAWCEKNCVNRRALIKAIGIRNQLSEYVRKMEHPPAEEKAEGQFAVAKALTAGFFVNMAVLQPDKSYRTFFEGQRVKIHPSSVLQGRRPECVLYAELVRTRFNYMRTLVRVERKWLAEVAPEYFQGSADLN